MKFARIPKASLAIQSKIGGKIQMHLPRVMNEKLVISY